METRKPSFFWQGVLILTPVIVLTAIGVTALWKERRFAMRDAEARAQQLASSIAHRMVDEFYRLGATTAAEERIRFDQQGNLLYPPPFESVPSPQPLLMEELSEDQRRSWEIAQAAELQEEDDRPDAARKYEQFLQSRPPPRFAALARFRRGVLLEQCSATNQAVKEFAEITNRFAGTLTESGLSLDLLARSHIQPRADFIRYAIDHPCAVTEQLITERAGAAPSARDRDAALESWKKQELFRDLARIVRAEFKNLKLPPGSVGSEGVTLPTGFWVTNREIQVPTSGSADASSFIWQQLEINREWLILPFPSTNGFSLIPRFPPAIAEIVESVLRDAAVPPWLDFTVTLAGRDLRAQGSYYSLNPQVQLHRETGPSDSSSLLCSVQVGEPPSALVLKGRLVKEDLLLAEQRRRTLWFAFIIATAGCASVVGFVSGYRAFHKQHRLAELKSNFVSSVSHELRAPVASIRLMAESLERGKVADTGKQHEYFRFIVQECRRLSSMIQNVLDFARIEQGRKQYQFEPTDLIELVRQTLKLMEPYAAERGVGLQFHSTQNELTATIDGPAIQQALINLIDNAIKHSPQGASVNVSITVSGDSLIFAVEDQGPGIPTHEHQKIFERFYRLGSELRRETPGVGIGLSIVKHVADAHRGAVRVQSEPGRGSRFILEIPTSAQQA